MCEPPKPTCSFPQDPAIVQVHPHTDLVMLSPFLPQCNANHFCPPQSSMSSSSSSSTAAAAPTPFQSAGSYGLFNRAPVPAYNQFSTSPLVSPQFGPVGVGEHNSLVHYRDLRRRRERQQRLVHDIQGFRVCLWLCYHVNRAIETEEGWIYGISVTPNIQSLSSPPPHVSCNLVSCM